MKSFKERNNLNGQQSFLELESSVNYISPEKSKFTVSMIQAGEDPIKARNENYEHNRENKFYRFLGAFVVVVITSVSFFFLIKNSIEWVFQIKFRRLQVKLS